jgi:BirA family transcriptional regulator, biotin operon repressor / biotin---[acetyl-CoA-carboxylase] ligase
MGDRASSGQDIAHDASLHTGATARATGLDSARWEGMRGDELAIRLVAPQVVLHDVVGSTMDVAHSLATDGAPSGTVVLADRQTTGRGRGGHSWVSRAESGIWLTVIERPSHAASVELWAVRHGISVARALDRFAGGRVSLKWPNDLHIASRKVAGILIEARWQDQRVLWVAVGIGINVREPAGVPGSGGLPPGTARLEVLDAVVPALRAAAEVVGELTSVELREWVTRDMARGRTCRAPGVGRVRGIGSGGELLIETSEGVRAFRSGSLVLDSDPEAA